MVLAKLFGGCLPYVAPNPPKLHDLRGTAALVTGVSEGLGVAIARRLAEEGVGQLAITARRRPKLEELAAELTKRFPSMKVLVVAADVSTPAACEALARSVLQDFGRCDILVNNAAVPGVQRFDTATAARVDQVLDVNLRAPMELARCLLPAMLKAGRGHIVNVSSLAGKGIEPYNSLYCASKYGLNGWSQSLRAELRLQKHAVTVHIVSPGFITDVGMSAVPSQRLGIDSVYADAIKAGGSSSQEEVANAVVRAIQFDMPEVVVNSNRERAPMQHAWKGALSERFPRRRDWLVEQKGFAPFLAWLQLVSDGQEKLWSK